MAPEARTGTLAVALSALLLTACGPGEEEGAAERDAPDRAMAEVDASLWSAEGLEVQLRMPWLRARTPPEMDFDPGTTPWRPLTWSAPEGGFAPGDVGSPGELLLALSRALGFGSDLGRELWEQTVRIHEDEEGAAVGVILRWGFMDDSVVGHDLRVRMREGEGGWQVQRVEERFHCGRGVTEEGLCM